MLEEKLQAPSAKHQRNPKSQIPNPKKIPKDGLLSLTRRNAFGCGSAALHCDSPTCSQAARNILSGSFVVSFSPLGGRGSGRGARSLVFLASLRFSAPFASLR